MPKLLPPRPFGPALVRRATLVWFLLHFAAGSAAALHGEPVLQALHVSLLAVLWVAVATMCAVGFEMWRHGELVFLANLGFSSARLCALVGTISVGLDLALGLSLG